MPELPDVELWRQYLKDTSLRRTIDSVAVDAAKLREAAPEEELRETLVEGQLTDVRRHGKHLFARIDDDGWLRLHFGMTGYLRYYEEEEPGDEGTGAPEHTCLRLDFSDRGHLAFVNVRKLGQIGLVDDPDSFVEERGLGPDPVADELSRETFRERLSGRRGMVKSTLMNQEVLAGLGNEYVDEILLDAGIHPRTKVADLGPEAVEQLYDSVRRVLAEAIEALRPGPEGDVDPGAFPEQFLLPDREPGTSCPRCGGEIRKTQVSGRSAYYCPEHQGDAA